MLPVLKFNNQPERTMNDTLETDELIKNSTHIKFLEEDHRSLNSKFTYTHPIVLFCRKLERELAAARQEIDMLKSKYADHHAEAERLTSEINAVTEQRDKIDSMYHKIIKEVLECDPIPACKRKDDQLEPPWEVIARVREQRDVASQCHKWCYEDRKLITEELTAVTEQRDRMAVALRVINTYDPKNGQCDDGYSPVFHARKALAAVEGGSDDRPILRHNGVGIADMYQPGELEKELRSMTGGDSKRIIQTTVSNEIKTIV